MLNDKPSIEKLLDVMAQLRDPERGCPWDREQTWTSLLPYTLEEAYEVADAIEKGDFKEIPNELGDLLFQVVFYAQLAKEEGRFDFYEIVEQLSTKLETRHPHVFGDKQLAHHELEKVWHKAKASERQAKEQHSALDDIPLGLPALSRAQKLQRRAANEGFDWPDHSGPMNKIQEELLELSEAIGNNDPDAIEDELGDVFFSLVNLSRHLEQDAETSLRRASSKFEQRFRIMETLIESEERDLHAMHIDELEEAWQRAKLITKD